MSLAWRRAAERRWRSARTGRRWCARRTPLMRHRRAWDAAGGLRCDGDALACAQRALAAAAGDEKAAAAARKIRASTATRRDQICPWPRLAAMPSKVPRTLRVLSHVIQQLRGASGTALVLTLQAVQLLTPPTAGVAPILELCRPKLPQTSASPISSRVSTLLNVRL